MSDQPRIVGHIHADPGKPLESADSLWSAVSALLFDVAGMFVTERERAAFLATFASGMAGALAADLGGEATADLLEMFAKTARTLPKKEAGRTH